jgi:hypothetical protein
MNCPKCSAHIPSEDVNLANLVAKCRQCDEVFTFADQVGGLPRPAAPVVEQRLPKPPYMILEDDERRRLWWRWLGPEVIFLGLFCVAWDGFLVFWYSMAIQNNAPWIMIVFPIVHLAVGVALTYSVVAMILNRTALEIAEDMLTVRHGPVPWVGNRLIPTQAIESLFCEENVSRGKQSTTVTHTVHACVGGVGVRLVSGMKDRLAAGFVKQQLEEWLGLAHRGHGRG